MSRHVFKLPDLGEGTVAAEIVAWRVKPGDVVAEDDVLVEVMTDKAAVEVPSPVSGKVISTNGNPGESVPVGSELIVFETLEGGEARGDAAAEQLACGGRAGERAAGIGASRGAQGGGTSVRQTVRNRAGSRATGCSGAVGVQPRDRVGEHGHPVSARAGRVATSPAIRRRAHEAGIDLSQIHGSGPNGRIVREDLDAFVARRPDRDRHHAQTLGSHCASPGVPSRMPPRRSRSLACGGSSPGR